MIQCGRLQGFKHTHGLLAEVPRTSLILHSYFILQLKYAVVGYTYLPGCNVFLLTNSAAGLKISLAFLLVVFAIAVIVVIIVIPIS